MKKTRENTAHLLKVQISHKGVSNLVTRNETTNVLSVQITHNMIRTEAADSKENTHIRLLSLTMVRSHIFRFERKRHTFSNE